MKNIVFLLVALLLVTACATTQSAPTSTSLPPPMSCKEVEGICLELTFDGESCSYEYEGPTDFKPGLGTIIFHNESDEWAAMNMIRIVEDKTLQDVILRVGEEPSEHEPASIWPWFTPSWWVNIPGVWSYVGSGESQFWEGVLGPGIYALFCIRQPPSPEPLGVWLGPSWTIEE